MITTLYPGGLSAETFVPYAKGYGIDIDYAQSKALRDGWLKAFPEMRDHLSPDQQANNRSRYIGKTTTGRIRSNCVYTEACNAPFVTKRRVNRVNSEEAA